MMNEFDYRLEQAINKASENYGVANPASAELFNRAKQFLPGGNTRSALYFDPFPLYMAESSGASMTDVDGHTYLDVLGDYTAGIYGHNDNVIRNAAVSALEKGNLGGAPRATEIEFAQLICERFQGIEQVRFCNSGTEANLYALTLAKIATNREKVLCFSGAYHGGVMAFSKPADRLNVPFKWVECQYNDSDGALAILDRMGDDIAAVIVEPMMSNGGCIPANFEFLKALRQGCSEAGALLIFDEVVTSRMGPGGLQGLSAVTPDLTTLGKYLGGGFTFGAFGGRADVLQHLDVTKDYGLPHAGTFNNNTFSMSAGLAAFRSIFTPERAMRLYEEGEALRERLNGIVKDETSKAQFTGVGSTMNIHFCQGNITRPEHLANEITEFKQLFQFDMIDQGIYIARRGQINLSLPMGNQDHDKIADAVETFFKRRGELINAS